MCGKMQAYTKVELSFGSENSPSLGLKTQLHGCRSFRYFFTNWNARRGYIFTSFWVWCMICISGDFSPGVLIYSNCMISTYMLPNAYIFIRWYFSQLNKYSTKKRASRASALRANGDWHTRHLLSTYPISPTPWTRPWRPLGPGAPLRSNH